MLCMHVWVLLWRALSCMCDCYWLWHASPAYVTAACHARAAHVWLLWHASCACVCLYDYAASRHLAVIWFGIMIDSFRTNHQRTSFVLPCLIDVTRWGWGGVGRGEGVCISQIISHEPDVFIPLTMSGFDYSQSVIFISVVIVTIPSQKYFASIFFSKSG